MNLDWKNFIYAFFWWIIIFASLFPSVFLEGSIDFLFPKDDSMHSISKSFIYGMSMAVVIHLIDMTYIVFFKNLTQEKLKMGFLATLISLCVIIISIILISSYNNYIMKISGFVVFWITLFVFKLFCIETTKLDEVYGTNVFIENVNFKYK